MRIHLTDEVLSPNAPTMAKACCQRHSLLCGSTDLTPLKDCKYDGLGPSGQRRSARTLRLSCPTLTKRADAQVKKKLGSDTNYFAPDIGSQFNSELKDLFRLKRVSILDNHSNHFAFARDRHGTSIQDAKPVRLGGHGRFQSSIVPLATRKPP